MKHTEENKGQHTESSTLWSCGHRPANAPTQQAGSCPPLRFCLLDLEPCPKAKCPGLGGNLWTLAGADLNLWAEVLIALLIRQFVWEHDQSHYP